MNNLNSVAFLQGRRRPLSATNNVAVKFDCDSRWLQIQREDQTFDRQASGKLARLSIHLNFQGVERREYVSMLKERGPKI